MGRDAVRVNDKRWRNWLVKHVQPGDTFVDVGANVGLFTLPVAEKVGPAGIVWAFEPDPDAYVTLQLSRSKNVIVRQMAISDKSATVPFYSIPNHSSHSSLYERAVTQGGNAHKDMHRLAVEVFW